MIISTTENNKWRELESVDRKGIELTVVEERQKIRGFGTCFSELGAWLLTALKKASARHFSMSFSTRINVISTIAELLWEQAIFHWTFFPTMKQTATMK